MVGRFISLEGGEGAGKSTLARALEAKLIALGKTVIVTREPGGTPGAELIRDLLVTGSVDRWSPLTELCLFYAARGDHLERVIRPALARGDWVLCDRFADSTMAYQGHASGAGRDAVHAMDQLIVAPTFPHLTLLLDLDVTVGLARAAARRGSETRFEDKERAFHERLREAYRTIAADNPDRCVVLDASVPPDAVADAAWHFLRDRLGSAL